MEIPPIFEVPPVTQPSSPSGAWASHAGHAKKRKATPNEDELKDLKQKAKFHCRDLKEWRVVSKFSKAKLETYLSDQTYLESAQIAQHFGSFATDMYGFLLDKVTKGGGFVEQEIKSDVTLRNAVQRELVEYVRIITNRLQILIFSGVNVLNGKKKQLAQNGGNDTPSERPHVDQFRDGVSQPPVPQGGATEWQFAQPDQSEWRGEEPEVGEEEGVSGID